MTYNSKKTTVLIVDDSALFRTVLSNFMQKDGSIEVVGTAGDPFEARDKILKLHPDAITLDIEMPKMNGIEFLKKLIPQYPIPVVVVTSLAINAFDALDAGAVDFVKKPENKTPTAMQEFADNLCETVKVASQVVVGQKKVITANHNIYDNNGATKSFSSASKISTLGVIRNPESVIAIGASTGGTDAIQVVVEDLPETTPPIVIVQHMPAVFTNMYAQRLNKICRMEVHEAKNGERLRTGLILIAPGEYQMRVVKDSRGYFVTCKQEEKVSGHSPSVDVLFESVAEVVQKNAIGVILTGMGSDGARSMLKMRNAGAFTIGQDKESCVVYGMPMVAYQIGAVIKQTSLANIPNSIYDGLKGKRS